MRTLRYIPAVSLAALAAARADAADGGFYLGLGAGGVQIEDQVPNPSGPGTIDFDSGRESFRGFLGYQASVSRTIGLGAELGYVDFGRASQSAQGVDLQYKLRGAEVAGLLIFDFRPVELFGKVGLLSWSTDKTIGSAASSSSGTNAFYGIGLGFNVASVGVRAEYDEYDVSSVNRLRTYSLNVLFRFY